MRLLAVLFTTIAALFMLFCVLGLAAGAYLGKLQDSLRASITATAMCLLGAVICFLIATAFNKKHKAKIESKKQL